MPGTPRMARALPATPSRSPTSESYFQSNENIGGSIGSRCGCGGGYYMGECLNVCVSRYGMQGAYRGVCMNGTD